MQGTFQSSYTPELQKMLDNTPQEVFLVQKHERVYIDGKIKLNKISEYEIKATTQDISDGMNITDGGANVLNGIQIWINISDIKNLNKDFDRILRVETGIQYRIVNVVEWSPLTSGKLQVSLVEDILFNDENTEFHYFDGVCDNVRQKIIDIFKYSNITLDPIDIVPAGSTINGIMVNSDDKVRCVIRLDKSQEKFSLYGQKIIEDGGLFFNERTQTYNHFISIIFRSYNGLSVNYAHELYNYLTTFHSELCTEDFAYFKPSDFRYYRERSIANSAKFIGGNEAPYLINNALFQIVLQDIKTARIPVKTIDKVNITATQIQTTP